MKKLKYKVYKCYEIVILDEEDNEVGVPDYCYTSLKEAKELAEYKLKLEEERRKEECSE